MKNKPKKIIKVSLGVFILIIMWYFNKFTWKGI